MTERPRFQRRSSTRSRTVFGEEIVVEQTAAVVHVLNPTGAFVWARLSEPATEDELVTAVADEFGIGADEARRDVRAFLAELEGADLITIASGDES